METADIVVRLLNRGDHVGAQFLTRRRKIGFGCPKHGVVIVGRVQLAGKFDHRRIALGTNAVNHALCQREQIADILFGAAHECGKAFIWQLTQFQKLNHDSSYFRSLC